MEYKILTVSAMWSFNGALEKLMRAVNESIALGWEPLGGPVAAEHHLTQAMIKRR